MGPLDTLMEEHRRIEEVLDAMTVYVSRLTGENPAEREDLGLFVEFIREFADTAHHGKEEDILFVAMTDAGMPGEQGPIAVMLSEHVQGRGYVGVLAEVAEGEGPLSAEERGRVTEAGENYVGLLRSHIQKEDKILYPMSENMVPADRWSRIAAEFEAFEKPRSAEHERLRQSAKALCLRFTGA